MEKGDQGLMEFLRATDFRKFQAKREEQPVEEPLGE
jgi:hypothetical protein